MDSFALRSVSDLPAPFRSTFSFRYFNSLQSECFPLCFLSDINMVVSAPTGSGKTVLFELCILRLLSKFLSSDGKFHHIKGTLKTIYIAPSKALVQEKLRDWNLKLGSWGISCLELTSDNESSGAKNIHEADIILTTPEKFDAVTRYRIKDGGLGFFSDIALLLIDEVHLLNDPRGAVLEAIVSRIKMLSHRPELNACALAHIRLIAVSATIPNIDDLAEWLMVPPQGIKRFGEEMRPIKLTAKVFGYSPARNDFLFERRLQNFIFDMLMNYSRGKSALVFCSTRKGAQEAALCLSYTVMKLGHSNPFIKFKEQEERLKEASLSLSDKQMQSCIIYGVGYHNGGLCLKDRSIVEGLFLKGDVQVLCTTNTLAHGINLPAHTVIIKSTQFFNKEKGAYAEYDRSMILQMCGRAGRPPLEETGTAIIMTRKETVHLYENLLNGCEMVESQLLSCTTEHLNAEIVQLTISDITLAIEWLKCSYLYVRMKKNPENYGIKKEIPSEILEKHMQEICLQKVNELSRYGMIWTDEYGFLLKPLEPGRLMTTYYLKFGTMKGIMQTPENCNLEDVLHTVCHSEEIAWIQLRRNEKKLLNNINSDKDGRLRFHVLGENGKRKKRIQMREEKIFVLVNDCLTGDPSVHDLSFNQDISSICSNGCRIARCMKEYFLYKRSFKGAFYSSLLAKCLHQRLWDDSPYLLKQLSGIGMVTAKALRLAGIDSFKTIEEADPRRIEIITGRRYPFGNHVKESLLSLPPKISIKIEEAEFPRHGKSKLIITLTRLSQSVSSLKRHYAEMLVGSEEDNLILFHEKMRAEEFSSPYTATVIVSTFQHEKLTVKAQLNFEEYVGLDVHEMLILTEKSSSSAKRSCGNQQATNTYSLPKEIYFVEVEENNIISNAPNEDRTSSKPRMAISSVPSFNLLADDDLDEGDHPGNTEECKSKAVTEHTIFNHIRKKSKNFPMLVTSPHVNLSPVKSLILTSKTLDKVDMNTLPDTDPASKSGALCISNVISRKTNECGHNINETASNEDLIYLGSSCGKEKSELSTAVSSVLTDMMEKSLYPDSLCASSGQRSSMRKQKCLSKSHAEAGVRFKNAPQDCHLSSENMINIKESVYSNEIIINNSKMGMGVLSSDIITLNHENSLDDEMIVEDVVREHHVLPKSSCGILKPQHSPHNFNVSIVPTKPKKKTSCASVVKTSVLGTDWERDAQLNKHPLTWTDFCESSDMEVDEQSLVSGTAAKKEASFPVFQSVFSFL